MKKDEKIALLIYLIIIIAVDIAAWIILGLVFLPTGDFAAWLLCCGFLSIVSLLPCVLIYYIPRAADKKFYKNLKENGFDTESLYIWENTVIGIDFEGKRFASNQLMVKPIVPFSDVTDCDVDVIDAPHVRWAEASKRIVRLVISVKQQGNSFDYFYIPVYKVVTGIEDFDAEDNEITENKIERYPDLQNIVLLKTEIDKILAINRADNLPQQTPTNEEWTEYLKSTTKRKFII